MSDGAARVPAGVTRRGRALRLGVARDTAATRHLVTFLVVTVATVLVTRFLLAASAGCSTNRIAPPLTSEFSGARASPGHAC